MISKMKKIYVVSSLSQKKEMLDGLKKLGILHIAERKSASRETSEYCSSLLRTQLALGDYAPGKKEKKAAKKQAPVPVLTGQEFDELYHETTATLERVTALMQDSTACKVEIDRITPWGDFNPADLRFIKESGYDFHFYRLPKDDYERALKDENTRLYVLAPVEKQAAVASLGALSPDFHGSEFVIPRKSIDELNAEIEENKGKIAECETVLRNSARYMESFKKELFRAENIAEYSSASETAENNGELVWLSGYVPEDDVAAFKAAATENSWAWAIDDVAEDDDKVPTKVKYSKISKLIEPLYQLLGILPGYRETDISLWFFLFFTLFFAMIIGDGGYGLLILIGTIAFTVKTKTKNTATYLLFVLSIATIIWGAITGTWFGIEAAMKVPFLKAMVIPSFANFPEYFGVTASAQQNTIMKFSFTIGAIQMSLGCLIAIKKKLAEHNLSWVADLGWMIAIVSMYMLALNLVIGEKIPMVPVFAGVGVAFLMVLLFGAMEPGKTFAQGLKAGLAGAFTCFLDTISCFGNVMSYVRLFAVGMAGLAISQSFNDIAAGFSGPLVIAGIVIVLLGHALNIAMCFLSVVVHGVRLNVLEFSGQIGLEWTGIEYEPFKDRTTK